MRSSPSRCDTASAESPEPKAAPSSPWPVSALREERDEAGRLTTVRFTHRGRDVHAALVVPPDGGAPRWRVTVFGVPQAAWLPSSPPESAARVAEQLVARGVTE